MLKNYKTEGGFIFLWSPRQPSSHPPRQKIRKIKSNQYAYTGLPTKNETSETTVRNFYWLFSYIHYTFFDKSWYKPFKDYIQFRSLIFNWDVILEEFQVLCTVSSFVGNPVLIRDCSDAEVKYGINFRCYVYSQSHFPNGDFLSNSFPKYNFPNVQFPKCAISQRLG